MKVLLVTFPNDLGSRTIETNLVKFVSMFADVTRFRFAAQDSDQIDKRIDNRRNLYRRIQDTIRLRKALRGAVKEGRKILFYNISPALFGYGSWKGGEAYITLDWARRLLADKKQPDRDPMTGVHRRVLHACKAVLPMTEAMAVCLREEYGLDDHRIRRVPSLFDIEHFRPNAIQAGSPIRLLFVGGDITRKGGDLLYQEFAGRLSGRCTLTMVTNADLPQVDGITQIKGIRYGTPEHVQLMQDHDIFVLPTREDAGPQVIGEAAAAGLAVFTTVQALGSRHIVLDGISGIIAASPEECLRKLGDFVISPGNLLNMRNASLEHMRQEFAAKKISDSFEQAMN